MSILRVVVVTSGLWVTVACAARSPYGNFVPKAPLDTRVLADDAVGAMASLYPPALTRVRMAEPVKDAFGDALVEGLRQRGYAFLSNPDDGSEAGKTVNYVVDRVDDDDLYQVTLLVDGQILARPYRLQGSSVVPAGNWVHKE